MESKDKAKAKRTHFSDLRDEKEKEIFRERNTERQSFGIFKPSTYTNYFVCIVQSNSTLKQRESTISSKNELHIEKAYDL